MVATPPRHGGEAATTHHLQARRPLPQPGSEQRDGSSRPRRALPPTPPSRQPEPAPRRQLPTPPTTRTLHPDADRTPPPSHAPPSLAPSWIEQAQPPSRWVQSKLELHELADSDAGSSDDEAEVNEIRFFNPAFLSEVALQLADKVRRGRHVKAGIAWVGSFTGHDIVSALQELLPPHTRLSPSDRRFALILAQTLQDQLWFVEVDWDIKPMRDSDDDVYRFMNPMEGIFGLPSGVMTAATRCYSPSCAGDGRCYSRTCPSRTRPDAYIYTQPAAPTPTVNWTEHVDPLLLGQLSAEQLNRQNIIRQAFIAEEQYEADLSAIETMFIRPLHTHLSLHPHDFDRLVRDVFGNIIAIRNASQAMLESFRIRSREQAPIVRSVGDIFLETASVWRELYPQYLGNLPHAENVLTQALDNDPAFKLFVERASRADRRYDLRQLLARPSAHLQRLPIVLESLLQATSRADFDYDFIAEALASIQNVAFIAQIKLFHASKGRGPAANIKWYEIVPHVLRDGMEKKEFQRQMHIWHLVLSEMEYVSDLETIEQLYIHRLRTSNVVGHARRDEFIDDVFHNYRSLLDVHSTLLERLQQRQIEQHPRCDVVGDLLLDAALNWQSAYMEYIPHFPLAKAKVEEEMSRPEFSSFLAECQRDPAAQRQDINHYIHRPVARLLRYPLILQDILDCLRATGPIDHPDLEAIPQILELIAALGRATDKGVAVNAAKVDLWTYAHSLHGGKFGPAVVADLDLRNPMRELLHKGRVFRQPEGSIGGAWTELQVLLFDHYLVLTKPIKSRTAQQRYTINRKPIPLELLKLGNFTDTAQNRSLGILRSIRGAADDDIVTVYPFTFSYIGGSGGQYTLWTDSAQARSEWRERLLHANVLRSELTEANKLFDMVPLSCDTFFMPPSYSASSNPDYTGRVTCSCPFATSDGRQLVAMGCQEGVWIGVQQDPRSLRQVLHVREVTQLAVLEQFGIFLVLADKSLLAYHLEALVPTQSAAPVRAAPQRLSSSREISYFAIGAIQGRTLVMYTKRRHQETIFRILEPVGNVPEQRRGIGAILGAKNEWFRLYKDFFIPTDALHVYFLRSKLAIVCARGFEIMDLNQMRGSAIPIFDPANKATSELKERCDAAKPLAMFRSTETEFLLCYDAFGIYVDRHGVPLDGRAIEWEGRPESIVFHPPYVLVVSSAFIEIRHVKSCKLVQIVTGSDIRTTWDGANSHAIDDAPGPRGYGDDIVGREPRIHICQRPDDGKRTRGIGQNVFALTPTVLLSNPLLVPRPPTDGYFQPAPTMHQRAGSAVSADLYHSHYTPSPNETSESFSTMSGR